MTSPRELELGCPAWLSFHMGTDTTRQKCHPLPRAWRAQLPLEVASAAPGPPALPSSLCTFLLLPFGPSFSFYSWPMDLRLPGGSPGQDHSWSGRQMGNRHKASLPPATLLPSLPGACNYLVLKIQKRCSESQADATCSFQGEAKEGSRPGSWPREVVHGPLQPRSQVRGPCWGLPLPGADGVGRAEEGGEVVSGRRVP